MSWVAVATGVGTAAGGYFSSKGKGGKVEVNPKLTQLNDKYLDFLNSNIGQSGKKYAGELVAPMTNEENASFDWLRKYGEGDLKSNTTYNNANKVVNDTLTNKYDPASSPYYQAIKAESARNLADTQKNIASNAAGAGRYWTGGRLSEQGDAAIESVNNLNTVLGSLAEKERQNQLSMVQQAMEMSDNEMNQDLKKATAFQTLGALPREIAQSKNAADYNEWLRSEVDYPMEIAKMAGATMAGAPDPTTKESEPSLMNTLLGGVLGNKETTSGLVSKLFSLFGKKGA